MRRFSAPSVSSTWPKRANDDFISGWTSRISVMFDAVRCSLPTCSSPQLGVSVHILVEEISKPDWPACIARLRTESPKPHVIACFDFHPVLVQTIHGLAFQNVKTVLHHVGLGEGDQGTGLEGYDSHMHVVAQVHRIYEASCGPSAFGVWHE